MSPKYYDLLLSKIDEDSPQYSLLKNAVIIDHSPMGVQRKTIDLICEIEQAISSFGGKAILHGGRI